ncbi:hypothetical protein ILYODFUR_011804 [Ilyodon furcidens]|uniref:Uncharacterized protein n=1 Tax=Ilyodon furcidens TaxID=33524 RepID=A0ABV0T7A6_9TELE
MLEAPFFPVRKRKHQLLAHRGTAHPPLSISGSSPLSCINQYISPSLLLRFTSERESTSPTSCTSLPLSVTPNLAATSRAGAITYS